MWFLNRLSASRLALLAVFAVVGAFLAWGLPVTGQEKPPADHARHQHADKAPDAANIADQIRDLQAKIAKLEAALQQGHQGAPSVKPAAGGMAGMPMGMMGGQKMGPGMTGKGGMEAMNPGELNEMGQMMQMMGRMMQQMGQMQGKAMGGGMGMEAMMGGMAGGKKGMGGMGMEGDDMGMMGMMGMASKGQGGMKGMMGMEKMQKAAALPGFPGASHIYHIGATGFFLDHPEHVQLTAAQQTALNHVKEKALLDKATAERKVEEAEQELWTLTGSDQPEASKIEAKVHAIEKLRGDQRLAFIRAVGEAAKVLTDEQRKVLLGTMQPKSEPTASHAGHQHGTDGKGQP
jgi:hypothetical protein